MNTLIATIFAVALLRTVECSVYVDLVSLPALPPGTVKLLIDYQPPFGEPRPNFTASLNRYSVIINQTAPSTDYYVRIIGLRSDGSQLLLSERVLPSSPQAPRFESVVAEETEAIISFLPPEGKNNLSYYLEYSPDGQEDHINYIETDSTIVRLQGLLPDTQYHLKILSVFKTIPSEKAIEANFHTEAHKTSPKPTFILQTLPPKFAISSSKFSSSSLKTTLPPLTTAEEILTSLARAFFSTEATSLPSTETTTSTLITTSTTTASPMTTTSTKTSTTPASTTMTTPITSTSTQTKISTVPLESTSTDLIYSPPQSTNDLSGTFTEDLPSKETSDLIIPSETQQAGKYGSSPNYSAYSNPPADIFVQKTGDQVRVDWEAPETTLCDTYIVNYTVLTAPNPNTFSVASPEPFIHMKMFPGHKVEIKASCMLEGSEAASWWAYRILDFGRPRAVENLRVQSVVTDEFYVGHVQLEFDWPEHHDFDYYDIVVSYSLGKRLASANEITVNKTGPVMISKLEPAKLYTFTVKNVSRELGISSQTKGLRQMMPPVITSTLYPGQISSYAININFGESDPEHKFEYYELTFSGSSKNITKRLEKDDQKSFTFNKLIPGKTYAFTLYTVYKDVYSRPVEAKITTYPLKVNKLYPVLGEGYATLYWDIENVADNDCRYRLSYTGTSNTGYQSTNTVELKNKNHYRFTNLTPDTYYTFTITVIMGVGDAEAESESETVTVGLAGRPTSLPVLQRYGSRELSVQFENDYSLFSDTNGVIDSVAVIVTEDPELGGDDFDLKSWYEVKSEDKWTAYRASPSTFNPFQKRTVKSTTFIIGEEDCERRRLDEKYCNGILRSNTNYMVKIRAYTVSNVAMETQWVSLSGAVEEKEAKETGRRLPCHMYLNGCPRKSASEFQRCHLLLLAVLSLLYLLSPFN
ncbi:hypothetical protein QR680_001129 [Steinernema hermaphroditum]|uniref:protein-tyrosine-phosphatase n=1 Tax=Steinernema hermaphroditum TaxID=289476 RepID=A0AA39GYM3_9BILA|nr:hypothetical protein QR680_001129 [Steinernema hermaphroditum]